jgi:hypothetical protein
MTGPIERAGAGWTRTSRLPAYVIGTDKELMIARHTLGPRARVAA